MYFVMWLLGVISVYGHSFVLMFYWNWKKNKDKNPPRTFREALLLVYKSMDEIFD